MPSEDDMSIDERRKYLKKQQERYRKATRKERGQLIATPPKNQSRPPPKSC